MRTILGYHIISDAELKMLIDNAREEQRQIESALTISLLRNAEIYRKKVTWLTGNSVGLIQSPIEELVKKSLEKRNKILKGV